MLLRKSFFSLLICTFVPLFLPYKPAFAYVSALLVEDAEHGDIASQVTLSNDFLTGENVDADEDKARYWMERAAYSGDISSMLNMAWLYYRQVENKKENRKNAFYWYYKASLKGDPYAQTKIGNMYFNGDGIKKDYDKAAYWHYLGQKNASLKHKELWGPVS